jgi:hypothetical protein
MPKKQGKPYGDSWLFSVVLTFFMVVATLGTSYAMRAAFFWAKKPASDALQLKRLSASWPAMKWLYIPVQWTAGLFAMGVALIGIHDIYTGHLTLDSVSLSVLVFLVVPLCGLVFMIFDWMEAYHLDPQAQKDLAGTKAEVLVEKIIEINRGCYPQCESLHGTLFVFNRGTPEEYSVEADHILITTHNIFLVETKYKSGIIFADADSPNWKISTRQGQGVMRNALLQVKNTARALQKEFGSVQNIVPIVAIYGLDVSIVGGPGNVVWAHNLLDAIDAFELVNQEQKKLDPPAILAELKLKVSTESRDFDKHLTRANAAKRRAELSEIVKSSSIS